MAFCPIAKVKTVLPRSSVLRRLVTTPARTRSTRPGIERFGMNAEIVAVSERFADQVGQGANTHLQTGAVRHQLGNSASDRLVLWGGSAHGQFDIGTWFSTIASTSDTCSCAPSP